MRSFHFRRMKQNRLDAQSRVVNFNPHIEYKLNEIFVLVSVNLRLILDQLLNCSIPDESENI